MNQTYDILGQLIKLTGKSNFRGKARLVNYWMSKRDENAKRLRKLPGGGEVICDLEVPYEAMVWLEQEEQQDLEILRDLLKPGQSFVDCGANIGIWTLVAASAVGEEGKVYAFEPNPYTFEKLDKNISLGTWESRVKLFDAAVGSRNINLPFQCDRSHNVSSISTPSEASITVPVVTLDSILKDTRIDGIKIDVEGFELEVLQGAETILKTCQPWLIVEFNTLLAKTNTLNQWEVYRYLSSIGYVCRQSHQALDYTTNNILPDCWQTNGYCNLYFSLSKA